MLAKKEIIVVENLKCHGCANTITTNLLKMNGVEDVKVNVDEGEVSIFHDGNSQREDFLKKLSSLGYPEEGTGNGFQKAKSYISCAVGRFGNP